MKTILICENDEDIVNACRLFLEGNNYRVVVAETTETLFHLLTTEHPDLILMDVWIPSEGGEVATRKIKNNDTLRSIPVIMFSANSELEKITQRSGADGFLAKPFELRQLIEIIERHT